MEPGKTPRLPRAAKENSTTRGAYNTASILPKTKTGANVSLQTVLIHCGLESRGAETDPCVPGIVSLWYIGCYAVPKQDRQLAKEERQGERQSSWQQR